MCDSFQQNSESTQAALEILHHLSHVLAGAHPLAGEQGDCRVAAQLYNSNYAQMSEQVAKRSLLKDQKTTFRPHTYLAEMITEHYTESSTQPMEWLGLLRNLYAVVDSILLGEQCAVPLLKILGDQINACCLQPQVDTTIPTYIH